MKRLVSSALLVLLAGCSDSTGPPRVAALRIFLGATEPVDASLEIGATATLRAEIQDADGGALTGRSIEWRSTAPAFASVDTAGVVKALTPGDARIIATADDAADTLLVRVVMPPSSFVGCSSSAPLPTLSVGQVVSVLARQATPLCLEGGVTGAEYTLVPFNATAGARNLRVEITAEGVSTAAGPPRPSLGGGGPLPADETGAAGRLHRRLREWEGANLGRLQARRAARGGPLLSVASAAAELSVGDTVHLNANANSACLNPDFRVARVEAVSEHAVVVADTLNPAGGFTRDEYHGFAEAFDEVVWPVDTESFGAPSDIDENGKVVIFFTKSVNDLTEPNSGSYVGGFFWGRDYNEVEECAGSNAREVFYMLVPDPQRGASERAFSRDEVAENTLGVIAHEFQHLINYSQRLANLAPLSEEVWLNEGLSHIAEELVFYRQTLLSPELNLDIGDIRDAAHPDRRDAANRYLVSNLARFAEHLQHPDSSSAIASDDELSTRGAAWAFLRYVADRKSAPANQTAFWRSLVGARRTGLDNLTDALGEDALAWLQDWNVAVYTDDALSGVESRYTQPSWDFRSLIGALFQGDFPLETRELRAGQVFASEFDLKGGGAAYLRFGVAPGQRATLRATSNGVTAPGRLRLSIVRTR